MHVLLGFRSLLAVPSAGCSVSKPPLLLCRFCRVFSLRCWSLLCASGINAGLCWLGTSIRVVPLSGRYLGIVMKDRSRSKSCCFSPIW